MDDKYTYLFDWKWVARENSDERLHVISVPHRDTEGDLKMINYIILRTITRVLDGERTRRLGIVGNVGFECTY